MHIVQLGREPGQSERVGAEVLWTSRWCVGTRRHFGGESGVLLVGRIVA